MSYVEEESFDFVVVVVALSSLELVNSAHSTKYAYTMSAVVPTAPAAIIGASPFLYFREYAVPKPMPAAQRRYCESKLSIQERKIDG